MCEKSGSEPELVDAFCMAKTVTFYEQNLLCLLKKKKKNRWVVPSDLESLKSAENAIFKASERQTFLSSMFFAINYVV